MECNELRWQTHSILKTSFSSLFYSHNFFNDSSIIKKSFKLCNKMKERNTMPTNQKTLEWWLKFEEKWKIQNKVKVEFNWVKMIWFFFCALLFSWIQTMFCWCHVYKVNETINFNLKHCYYSLMMSIITMNAIPHTQTFDLL